MKYFLLFLTIVLSSCSLVRNQVFETEIELSSSSSSYQITSSHISSLASLSSPNTTSSISSSTMEGKDYFISDGWGKKLVIKVPVSTEVINSPSGYYFGLYGKENYQDFIGSFTLFELNTLPPDYDPSIFIQPINCIEPEQYAIVNTIKFNNMYIKEIDYPCEKNENRRYILEREINGVKEYSPLSISNQVDFNMIKPYILTLRSVE
jgi:hypothetical protein